MRIRRIDLLLETDQSAPSYKYAKALCCQLHDGAPSIFVQEDESLPQENLRVRLVQQSIGPTDAPEFGEPPRECAGFRYVGTAFAAAYAYHVFIYDG